MSNEGPLVRRRMEVFRARYAEHVERIERHALDIALGNAQPPHLKKQWFAPGTPLPKPKPDLICTFSITKREARALGWIDASEGQDHATAPTAPHGPGGEK